MFVRRPFGHPAARRMARRVLGAVSVLAVLLVAGCNGDGGTPSASTTHITELTASTVAVQRAIRIMPLGDSLTEGGDPSQPATSPQSYRGYLEASLKEAGYDVDFVGSQEKVAISGTDPDHEGHGGFTIGPDRSTLCTGCGPANLDASLEGWLTAATPDVVLLMIGVNDLLPQTDPGTGLARDGVPSEAGDRLVALVGRIRTIAPDAAVVVASYPPTSFLVDPALTNLPAFTKLAAAAKALGSGGDDHIAYAPMLETLTGSWTAADVLSEAGDQLHPSATGAKRIAEVWFEAMKPLVDARQGD